MLLAAHLWLGHNYTIGVNKSGPEIEYHICSHVWSVRTRAQVNEVPISVKRASERLYSSETRHR